MSYDFYYILIIGATLLGFLAQASVKNTYSKFAKVISRSGVTAQEAARIVMESQGVYDVPIRPIAGSLTDNYNPSTKTLNLSQSVYNSTSIAALGVAAHEAGHAIQHAKAYGPLITRNSIVPVVNLTSKLSMPLLLVGLLLNSYNLAMLGILAYGFAVAFQLITLPVELNASRRALDALVGNGLLAQDEEAGAKKVLKAAASTYAVAALTAVLQLLRLLALVRGGNSRKR